MKSQYRSALVGAMLLLTAGYFSLAISSAPAIKANSQLSSEQQLLREIHKELVEINTTDPPAAPRRRLRQWPRD